MRPDEDREVRKNCIAAIAVIAGRAAEQHHAIDSPPLVDDLVVATTDSDSLIRNAATFALGLIPSSASKDRLTVLLTNADANTRINAAVALARQKSTAGYPVFKEVLSAASKPPADPGSPAEVEALLSVKNALRAVRDLASAWTPAERSALIALIEPISKNHVEPRIRADAVDAVVALHKT
jgi:HEAT repeat protein